MLLQPLSAAQAASIVRCWHRMAEARGEAARLHNTDSTVHIGCYTAVHCTMGTVRVHCTAVLHTTVLLKGGRACLQTWQTGGYLRGTRTCMFSAPVILLQWSQQTKVGKTPCRLLHLRMFTEIIHTQRYAVTAITSITIFLYLHLTF